MKKILFILPVIMLGLVLGSCSDDEDCSPISSKILGKWKRVSWNGEADFTNDHVIFTFSNSGSGSVSFSKKYWYTLSQTPIQYNISDNIINYTFENNHIELYSSDKKYTTNSLDVSSVNDSILIVKMTKIPVDSTNTGTAVFKKATTDYSKSILGTWEGELGYNGLNCRLKFSDDMTETVYTLNESGLWEPNELYSGYYGIDGDWLAYSAAPMYVADHNAQSWDIDSLTSTTLSLSAHVTLGDSIRNLKAEFKRVAE